MALGQPLDTTFGRIAFSPSIREETVMADKTGVTTEPQSRFRNSQSQSQSQSQVPSQREGEAKSPVVGGNGSDSADSSPAPSSPLHLDSCPQLDISTSTASSGSSISDQSTASSRLSDGGVSIKRRGYSRPQVTMFSDSAKNRESVMSLGSIAHLQYYFARTGLLDGKGAQLARGNSNRKSRMIGSRSASLGMPTVSSDLTPSPDDSYAFSDGGLHDSPVEQDEEVNWDRQYAMLPPTVSTYNQRPAYVAPPPDLTMLRRELTEALEDALKVLKESDKGDDEGSQGWYEIQGLHLLDITTLAIRAAKNYYTAHTEYQKLYAIKSEREIRSDLYQILEILKRMASRNFAGGIRQAEKVGILTWIVGISELIQTEMDMEKKEAEEREKWTWISGDWTGRERQRERQFIQSFIDVPPDSLAEWMAPSEESGESMPFLKFFRDGLQLVLLHNTLVRRSKRIFEEIKVYHTDTAKPYRCAENLRFWIKAAQLRWEINLKVDVMGVVQGSSPEAWRQFDKAILTWCQGVREELMTEMKQYRKATPKLEVESHEGRGRADQDAEAGTVDTTGTTNGDTTNAGATADTVVS